MRRIAVGVVLLLGLTACGSSSAPSADKVRADNQSVDYSTLHGAVPTAHDPKPEFKLDDTSGHPFDLGTQTHGAVTLLYFGYTHCPDQCPTAMADVAAALRRTDPSVASHVKVVFVTTDPWRDKAPVLRKWLDKFSSSFIGLTGTPAQVAGAEVAMGMPISKREAAPKSYGSGRYAVNHLAAVFAYGRDGRLATLYPSGVTPADIAADIPVLVKG